jgi:SAM-dependent methyltransferase
MAVDGRDDGPSLEEVLESGVLQAEVLHPGGLEITRELAERCRIEPGQRVLDVASGSGAAACFIAETFRCRVEGIDASEHMIERAQQRAEGLELDVAFQRGDAHAIPFEEATFDAAISECTTCILDKPRAIKEMVRVTKPGGWVGIHDLCWKPDAPGDIKQQLVELEGERPETLEGWKRLFEASGLIEVGAADKSELLANWGAEVKRQLGLSGLVRTYWRILRRWGFRGVSRIRQSEQVFRSEHLGYGVIVGRKSEV